MKLSPWFKRRRWERRMEAEFRFHLEAAIDEYVRQGLSQEEAELRARREFGAVELAKDEVRDYRPVEWVDRLSRDVRYALRSLRKSPGFTIAAIATLALGIGANTAIFQLLDAVRLRTLPVKDPDQLAMVQLADRTGWRGSQATMYPALTNPIWERFRDTQDTFSGVLAWADNDFGLSPGGEQRLARGLFVSGDFFRVLGVEPIMGRVFTSADDRRGCGLPGAVISYSFWQRELGSASVIGRKLMLNFHNVDIIGVTPAGFSGVEVGRSYDVAVPICSQAALWSEGNWLDEGTVWWLTVMGRLKPGETLKRADAQLRATTSGIFEATLPKNYPAVNVKDYLKFKLAAAPAGNGVSELREQYGDPLLLLLATGGLVLLIACANIANLILARSTAREHEFAVRLAIGASRSRLIRQLMTESVLLAVCGAVVGLFVSSVLSRFLVALLGTQGDALFLDLRPDSRVFVFTLMVASLTCILFGLMPAFRATRAAPSDAMKTGGRSLTANREKFGLRQVLVISQVSLSLVLLVGALLFSASLRNLLAVDAGFERHGILLADVDLFRRLNIPFMQRVAFKRDLIERIRAVPGVVSAAEVDIVPLSGSGTGNEVWRDGEDANRKSESYFNSISDGYFKTMGTALLAGRDFNDHDTTSSPKVAIVNQSFAHRLGLGANPVGMRFRRQATPSDPEQAFEIVGLVRDTKYFSLREDFVPIAYLSTAQDTRPAPSAEIMIRSTTSVRGTASGVRRAVAQVSPLIGVDFRAFEATIDEGLLRERLMATLSGFFGGLAALIAAIGLYGVMSYLAARRTNEIGIRIALGADRRNILALIMRQAGALLAAGLSSGALLAIAAAGIVRSILFGLKPYDARTLALAAALLAAVTLAASYVPARRAARLDPMAALREE
ncbi:MAG: ABC transporter permease [Bryobacteraceae bacterium]